MFSLWAAPTARSDWVHLWVLTNQSAPTIKTRRKLQTQVLCCENRFCGFTTVFFTCCCFCRCQLRKQFIKNMIQELQVLLRTWWRFTKTEPVDFIVLTKLVPHVCQTSCFCCVWSLEGFTLFSFSSNSFCFLRLSRHESSAVDLC